MFGRVANSEIGAKSLAKSNPRLGVMTALMVLQQRVAVFRRVRHEIGGDVAAGPAPVLDDELLAEQPAERLCEHARGNIARGAGTKANDDAHRPRRIGLRFCHPRYGRQRGSARGQMQECAAGKFHGDGLPGITSVSRRRT
jgi:hypothetical protein